MSFGGEGVPSRAAANTNLVPSTRSGYAFKDPQETRQDPPGSEIVALDLEDLISKSTPSGGSSSSRPRTRLSPPATRLHLQPILSSRPNDERQDLSRHV